MSLYESLMERLDGHQYSHYFSAYCPKDSHKDPALLVFDDGLAKCLSCNKVWTHKQLDRMIGSHYIPKQHDTVSKILPAWRKWEEKYDDLEGIVDAAHRTLKRHVPFQAYFKKRKIHDYVDEGTLGFLDSWVTFPVYDSKHRLVDIVVRSTQRNSDVRYVVHPNMGNILPLYVPSWERIAKSEVVYCVFGIIDSISLHLAGLPCVTGISGKSLSADLLRPLNKRFIILPDAGEESDAHKLANKLGWRCTVKQLDFPEKCKDVDDIRRQFGNQMLLQTIGA